MEQYSMTEQDHECIAELTRRAAETHASGVVSWWSERRRILWLRLFVDGAAGAWMMAPAADPAEAARQREAFCQLIGIQLELRAMVGGGSGAVAH